MATFPDPIMSLRLTIHAIVLCAVLIAVTAGALTGATSTEAVRGTGSVQVTALNHDTRDVIRSIPSLFLGLVRQRYARTIRGQLGLSDMVQLIALCGFIYGMWVWRRRSASQSKDSGSAGSNERKASSNTRDGSSRSFNGSPNVGMHGNDPTRKQGQLIMFL